MMAASYQRRAVVLAVQKARALRTTPSPSIRFNPSTHFSTRTETDPSTDDLPPDYTHPQSFVNPGFKLEPGELSDLPPNFHQYSEQGPLPIEVSRTSRHARDGRDAYWRPPWKSRAEIISAEDFNNMPKVTFSESFDSLADGMIVLSWMNDAQATQMYQLYVDLMTTFVAKQKKSDDDTDAQVKDKKWGVLSAHTSHEYVVRVVAQEHNVTTSRAAGVIQLKHNEEQLKKDPDFKVNHKVQAHVDNMVRQQISDLYRSYGEKDPLEFVEDPIASSGAIGHEDIGSRGAVRVSDLIDVDALVERKKRQEKQEAIRKMRTHIYVEDVDLRTVNVRIDKEARRFLKNSKKLGKLYSTNAKRNPVPEYATPYPENNQGYKSEPNTRRPRWKYAAQIINTKALERCPNTGRRSKKVAARIKAKRHGRVVDGNTLIEHDGEVRVATRAEVEQTSWKQVRNESEFMFKGVKDAWMRRQLEGEVGGWGPQEEVNPPEPQEEEETGEKENGEDDEESSDGDSDKEGAETKED